MSAARAALLEGPRLYDVPAKDLNDEDLLNSTIRHEDLQRKETWGSLNPACAFCGYKYRFRKFNVMCHVDAKLGKGTTGKARQVSACQPAFSHNARMQEVLGELRARAKALETHRQDELAAKKRRREGDGSAGDPMVLDSSPPSLQNTLMPKISMEQLEDAVAEMIIGNGLAISTVDSMYFRKAMCLAAQGGQQFVTQQREGKKDITLFRRKHFSEIVIPRVDARLQADSTARMRGALELNGGTIVSDGWQSTSGRPIVNVILCVDGHQILVKAVDTSGHDKTMQYIADTAIAAIREVGPEKVSFAVHCT